MSEGKLFGNCGLREHSGIHVLHIECTNVLRTDWRVDTDKSRDSVKANCNNLNKRRGEFGQEDRSTSGEKWSNPEYILRILLIRFAKVSDMKYERQESRMTTRFLA